MKEVLPVLAFVFAVAAALLTPHTIPESILKCAQMVRSPLELGITQAGLAAIELIKRLLWTRRLRNVMTLMVPLGAAAGSGLVVACGASVLSEGFACDPGSTATVLAIVYPLTPLIMIFLPIPTGQTTRSERIFWGALLVVLTAPYLIAGGVVTMISILLWLMIQVLIIPLIGLLRIWIAAANLALRALAPVGLGPTERFLGYLSCAAAVLSAWFALWASWL
jgi:hypothetical protein